MASAGRYPPFGHKKTDGGGAEAPERCSGLLILSRLQGGGGVVNDESGILQMLVVSCEVLTECCHGFRLVLGTTGVDARRDTQ
jgi:hypothetical protein